MPKQLIALLIFCTVFPFLLFAQSSNNEKELLQLLTQNGFRVNADNGEGAEIVSEHTDPIFGLQYVYLQQTWQGIKIFNAIQSLVTKDQQLQYASGRFFQHLPSGAHSLATHMSAFDAIKEVAKHLALPTPVDIVPVEENPSNLGAAKFSPGNLAKQPIYVRLIWVNKESDSLLHLSWQVEIDCANTSDFWMVCIDAVTGELIRKHNYTLYEHDNPLINEKPIQMRKQIEWKAPSNSGQQKAPSYTLATYSVIPYPIESVFVGSMGTETNPWLKAGTTNNATTNGWHNDGTSNYPYTRGNNVYAYDDSLKLNAPGRPDTATTITGNTLRFNRVPNFTQSPSTTVNRQFATDNLFYWNNISHDILYQYGFTEAAGNFQNDNLGRGGLAGDYIKAEAQDGLGTNNANFTTYVDGISGRMQMYLYTPNNSSLVTINTPSAIAGNYAAVEGNLSTNNLLKNKGPVTANVVFYNDNATTATTHYACKAPVNSLTGKIALIDNAGVCNYATKIKNAQNAGAVGVLVYATGNAFVMNGLDPSITIPAVTISSTDGALLATQLTAGATVNVTLFNSVMFDGSLDNGIITHEYAHGVSIRLTGGSNTVTCLINKEQGGEGWSDYISLMLTTNWKTAKTTDGVKPITHACYAYSQISAGDGNRTYPYSTDMSINPLTYADVATNGQVHFIGEIWCSVLWDMTWNIIQQVNQINSNLYAATGGGGNNIALQLVMTGLKLQPCSPGFLDARDAILAADSILYGGAYNCAIWKAFARRGMGFSAKQGSSDNTTDQVAAFDVPCFNISGRIINPSKVVIPNTAVSVTTRSLTQKINAVSGLYGFTASNYVNSTIKPYKTLETAKTNGVSVLDINLTQVHILGRLLFNSPYKLIAADVDGSGNVSTLDLLYMKRFILGLDTIFPKNRRWVFVDSSSVFANPNNPFPYKDSIAVKDFTSNQTNKTFIGIKLGDVNYDWNASILRTQPVSTKPLLLFYEPIRVSSVVQEIRIPLRVKHFNELIGLQFTLRFNPEVFAFKSLGNNPFGVDVNANNSNEGMLSFLWYDNKGASLSIPDSTLLIECVLQPRTNKFSPQDISINGDVTEKLAYNHAYQLVAIEKGNGGIYSDEDCQQAIGLASPNPTKGMVNASITLQKESRIYWKLTDVQGRVISQNTEMGKKGIWIYHFDLKKNLPFLPSGVYSLEITTNEAKKVEKIWIQ